MLMSQTLSTSAGSTDTALTCDSPTKWTSEQRRTPGQPQLVIWWHQYSQSQWEESRGAEQLSQYTEAHVLKCVHSGPYSVAVLILSTTSFSGFSTGQETVGDLGAETGIIAGKESWNKITELGLCAYWAVTLYGICVMIKYRNSYLQEWPQDIKKKIKF